MESPSQENELLLQGIDGGLLVVLVERIVVESVVGRLRRRPTHGTMLALGTTHFGERALFCRLQITQSCRARMQWRPSCAQILRITVPIRRRSFHCTARNGPLSGKATTNPLLLRRGAVEATFLLTTSFQLNGIPHSGLMLSSKLGIVVLFGQVRHIKNHLLDKCGRVGANVALEDRLPASRSAISSVKLTDFLADEVDLFLEFH